MGSTAIDSFGKADPLDMASPSGKACSADFSWHIGSIVTTDTELTGHGDCTVGIESRQAQDFLQM